MNNFKRLPRNYTMLTDWYEFMMADGYELMGKGNEEVVFDVFFRKVPNDGGYSVMAGVDKMIEYIKNLRFEEEDINFLRLNGMSEEILEKLKEFKFHGTIKAIPDGTPVFPNEPLITVKAPIIEAQVIETALLSLINGAMEHATGARRIIEAVPKNVPVMEFGARRADGVEAAIDSSIYGVMAGCAGTSNTLVAKVMGMKPLGTMAHSFVETFDNELDSFKAFASKHPENATLLVDTYDTLRSGVPNAIKTFNWMKQNNIPVDHIGIRIDSGDLAYLSKESRKMLDAAGYQNAKICLSNGLTAEVIEALIRQGAVFDSLGVGDNISKPNGRMGCVYKEVAIKKDGKWLPKIKLSNDTIKIVNPFYKRLYRAYDNKTGYALADVMVEDGKGIDKNNLLLISPQDRLKNSVIDDFNLVEIQKEIFKDGVLVYNDPSLLEKKAYCESEMNKLYPEIRRELNPHEYRVSGTKEYVDYKEELIRNVKEKYIGECNNYV